MLTKIVAIYKTVKNVSNGVYEGVLENSNALKFLLVKSDH